METANKIIGVAILGGIVYVGYQYVQCMDTVGSSDPLLVIPCILGKSVKVVVDEVTCATGNFYYDSTKKDFVPCRSRSEVTNQTSEDDTLSCRAFGINCASHDPNCYNVLGMIKQECLPKNTVQEDQFVPIIFTGNPTNEQRYETYKGQMKKYIKTGSIEEFRSSANILPGAQYGTITGFVYIKWNNCIERMNISTLATDFYQQN